jgi:hypothetical protein
MMALALTAQWATLTLLVVCGHWPLDVLESFATYNLIDPENFRASFRVSRMIDQFLRVIPDAAMFFVISRALDGQAVGLGSSLAQGMYSYGRMWLTRFMTYLSLLSLLLLVLPGVYLLTRWSFSEATVVGEDRAGTSAFGRSWELTRGRFWSVFAFLFAGGALYASVAIVAAVAGTLIVDEWWMDALTSMLTSLLRPIWMAYLFCLYAYLRRENTPVSEPRPEPVVAPSE